ncbi:MAG: hypothetical protein U0228_25110 [Myxococcaceae bacterium]
MDAAARLTRFLADTGSDSKADVTTRALVFHMLEAVAPRLYATHGLAALHQQALEQCARIAPQFDDVTDPDEAQAIVDAWYLRHVRGLKHPRPQAAALRALLEHLEAAGNTVYAWLLGELAAKCGVDVRLTFSRADFKSPRVFEGYYLTHLVMLDTDYFTRPARHADAGDWADAIAQLVPWLTRAPNPDLAGEVALCLRFFKRPEATAALALVNGLEPGEDVHQQATILMGMAFETAP